MSRRHPLVLERLRNVDGEMLRSRDFRDRIAYDLELHWWHQRAVHQAFGVASGLDVSDPQGGELTVAPGVAYDASGRDLVLLDQATVDLPTSGPPITLVLRPSGAAPDAKLVWKAPVRVDPCDDVALALFDPGPPGSVQRLAVAARSLASPRASGQARHRPSPRRGSCGSPARRPGRYPDAGRHARGGVHRSAPLLRRGYSGPSSE